MGVLFTAGVPAGALLPVRLLCCNSWNNAIELVVWIERGVYGAVGEKTRDCVIRAKKVVGAV